MNKKLLALAVTSALAGVSAGVNADTANVNVYGKLYPQFQVDSAKGASSAADLTNTLHNPAAGDAVSHQELNATNSLIGFKGEDTFGSGMKGWFQVEQQVNLDTGNGTWSSRNSAAGLSGGFGNVFLGKWDTVYKQLGDPVGLLGVNGGAQVLTSNVLSAIPFQSSLTAGQAGANTANIALATFHVRQNNYIEYDSPKLGGLTIMAGYAPDEGKSATKSAYLRDIGVKFEAGPLYVALANELHHDFFGASANLPGGPTGLSNGAFNTTTGAFTNTAGVRSKDTATRLSAMYKLPTNTTIGIDVAQLQYKEEGGAVNRFEKYKHRAMALVVQQQMGNLGVAGSLVKSDKGTCSLTGGADCDPTGLDAQMVNLGVRYDFSKRTGVFALYSQIKNKDSAQFNNIGTSTTVISPGADPKAVSIGTIITF